MSQSPKESKIRTVLAVPIHQHLGLTLDSLAPTPVPTALAHIITTSSHLTPTQTLHGGITNLLLDSICYLAALEHLPPDSNAATISSSFQMVGAVSGTGKKAVFEGKVVGGGKRILYCESTASCEGRVLARGMLTKMVLQPRKEGKSKL